jgi:hypothetical protein
MIVLRQKTFDYYQELGGYISPKEYNEIARRTHARSRIPFDSPPRYVLDFPMWNTDQRVLGNPKKSRKKALQEEMFKRHGREYDKRYLHKDNFSIKNQLEQVNWRDDYPEIKPILDKESKVQSKSRLSGLRDSINEKINKFKKPKKPVARYIESTPKHRRTVKSIQEALERTAKKQKKNLIRL